MIHRSLAHIAIDIHAARYFFLLAIATCGLAVRETRSAVVYKLPVHVYESR